MTEKTALLLDRFPYSGGNSRFMLQLADFAVIDVASSDEAVNWISQRRHSSRPVDLLLIDHPASGEVLPTLRRLDRARLELPVLLVRRDIDPDSAACATSPLAPFLYVCRPEQVAQAARNLTNPGPL